MNDVDRFKIAACKKAIERYVRMLETDLSTVEREYVHTCIARERADLESLENAARRRFADHASVEAVVASQAAPTLSGRHV